MSGSAIYWERNHPAGQTVGLRGKERIINVVGYINLSRLWDIQVGLSRRHLDGGKGLEHRSKVWPGNRRF